MGESRPFLLTHLFFFRAVFFTKKTAEVLPSSQEVDVVQLTLQLSVVGDVFFWYRCIIMENPMNKWDDLGGKPIIFGNTNLI